MRRGNIMSCEAGAGRCHQVTGITGYREKSDVSIKSLCDVLMRRVWSGLRKNLVKCLGGHH